jgi:hypothetical protein
MKTQYDKIGCLWYKYYTLTDCATGATKLDVSEMQSWFNIFKAYNVFILFIN